MHAGLLLGVQLEKRSQYSTKSDSRSVNECGRDEQRSQLANEHSDGVGEEAEQARRKDGEGEAGIESPTTHVSCHCQILLLLTFLHPSGRSVVAS